MRGHRMAGRYLQATSILLGWCVLGAPVHAQVTDTTRADTVARPFVRGGVYDKPFLTRLGGRSVLGGYAEAQARYERVDGIREQLGFEARRFNLFANARVSDFVRLGAELEVEDGGREISLEFAAIDVRVHAAFTLRAGMLLSPIGRFNLAHDSPLNEFTDRPLVSTQLLGVALSEPGVGAFGQFRTSGAGRITYEAYATNGFHDGLILDSPDGTRVARGTDNCEDNNATPSFVGRLAWSAGPAWELGISAHVGPYNTYRVDGAPIDRARQVNIWALDAEGTFAGITASGEAAVVDVDVPESMRGVFATRQAGAFIDLVRPFGRGWVRTMPASAFALKARWDLVDFDRALTGDSRQQFSAGVNFRPTQDTALKLDFVRGRARDRFNNASDHAFALFSIATYF
ncbi:MAG: hypothetical protein JNJ98_13535 [Gemmatimonadetes bacterium]|nr:hypothetical protein [Gemmatimonadota bacterium]